MKVKFAFRTLFSLSIISVLCSCSDVEFSNNEVDLRLLGYEVVSVNGALSDGVAEAIVTIKIFRGFGKPYFGHSIAAGSVPNGVNVGGCLSSDINGIVTCRLTSTISGVKNIEFLGLANPFFVDVPFTRTDTFASDKEVNFSSMKAQSVPGYSVTTNVGNIEGKEQNQSGFTIKTQFLLQNY